MTSAIDASFILRRSSGRSGSGTYNSWIQRRQLAGNNSNPDMTGMNNNNSGANNGNNGNNRSGSVSQANAPSTAVAMIILYSITGVITALFLIIIVAGAIRAHRHPETYGPRNITGRPRQTRARGIARAMLDSIPIVKFGETTDEQKPSDVELADGSTQPRTTANGAPNNGSGIETSENQAGTDGLRAPATVPTPTPEDSLGCSICTEDFEVGQDVRVLPCNHQFHPACIDPWLLNVSGTCPLW